MPPTKDWEEFKKIPIHMGTLIHFKLCFERADQDRDGKIDIMELGEWAQGIGLRNISFEDLKQMIAQVDVNHHGRVDFWEFLAIQLYISLNLQDTVDLLEFIKFLNQSYTA
eukprot:RCo008855